MSDFRKEIFGSGKAARVQEIVGKMGHRRLQCLFSPEANAFADNVSRDDRAGSHYWPTPIHLRDVN